MNLSNEAIEMAINKYDVKIYELRTNLVNLETDRDKLMKLKDLELGSLFKKMGIENNENKKGTKLIPNGYSKVCVDAAVYLITHKNKPIDTDEILNHVLHVLKFDFGINAHLIDDKRKRSTCYSALANSDTVCLTGGLTRGMWRLKTK